MIGDTIVIERSGDVIPKVISVLKNLRSGEEKIIKAPKICPICEGKIDRVGEEVAYRCLNKNCYAVNLRKISHFISKGAVDMEGVGPKVIEQFLEIGLIKDAADLYTLKKEDLLSLERFAEKKADNVLKIIEIKKKIDLAHFIFALGIRHVGEETAEIISKLLISDLEMMEKGKGVFSIASLIKYFLSKNLDYFQQINGLGPIMGESIYNYFQDEHNLNLLKKFDDNGVEISLTAFLKKAKIENKNFKDKTFVLTGSLLSLTRETAKDKIKELGGKVSADVSVKTDYLLLGDDPGSKFEKAKKLGVKIITEEEFLKMI